MQPSSIKILFLILCFTILLPGFANCQEDTLPHHSFHIYGGLIISKALSNYPLRSNDEEESNTTYRAMDTLSKFTPGFLFGFDLHFMQRENFNLLLGASFSRTTARFHSTYSTEGPTNRTGFTTLQRTTESDVTLNYSAINIQAGFRRWLGENFFAGISGIVNAPIRINQSVNSSVESKYTNNSGGSDVQKFYINTSKTPLKQKPANLSLRLTAEYKFSFGETESSIFLFRNFGLIYALPWWGVGCKFNVGS